MSSIGLGYEDISRINPRIIYCSVSGFGASGPYAKRAGFDVIAASLGGFLSITGPENGEPCKAGVAITDLTTGLHANSAILAALIARNQTGLGMHINCDLLSTQIAMLVNAGVAYLNSNVKRVTLKSSTIKTFISQRIAIFTRLSPEGVIRRDTSIDIKANPKRVLSAKMKFEEIITCNLPGP